MWSLSTVKIPRDMCSANKQGKQWGHSSEWGLSKGGNVKTQSQYPNPMEFCVPLTIVIIPDVLVTNLITKALLIMFSCDGMSDHASWNEVFHYWDTKLSCLPYEWWAESSSVEVKIILMSGVIMGVSSIECWV